jgi:hypothetical protein
MKQVPSQRVVIWRADTQFFTIDFKSEMQTAKAMQKYDGGFTNLAH